MNPNMEFWVQMRPVSKQSFRISSRGHYQTKKVKDAELLIAKTALAHRPPNWNQKAMYSLDITFYFRIPKNDKKVHRFDYYPKNFDLENGIKLVKDALQGVVYENDKQVVEHGECIKQYADSDWIGVYIRQVENDFVY